MLEEVGTNSPLAPALVAPDSKLPVQIRGADDVEFCVREVGKELYILACKREGQTVQVEFSGLREVALLARSMERKNTAGIHACYEAALKEKDYPAQMLLHDFIREQVEEEDWAEEMVERVEQSTCAGAVSDLDRHIERYLKDDAADAAKA